MLSIFEELVNEKILALDLNSYKIEIDKLYSDKEKIYLYNEYDKIINEELISPIEELNLLKENKDLKSLNKTLFIRSLKIDSIKRMINKKIDTKEINKYKNNNFRYYPDIREYKKYDTFLKELSKKKEFAIHYIPKKRINSCIKSIFTLSPHQLFLKNYMSPNTPYNSILIFHGVGVGKTCSGVSIAENFKDLLGKTIVLAPEKIQSGWKKNIYDPLKENNQCTGEEYIQDEDNYEKNKDKIAKKRIKEYYEMFGYLSFSNSVKRYLEENTKMISKKDVISLKQKEIELIREKYSNRVLIIDEVHKIRSDDSLIKERDTIIYIEKVIKYSDNLKLILLTANPMFNQPEEIVWILNMMLLNDKREIIKDTIKFEGNTLTKQSEELIREYSKGYISYLRGENPTTFPYRIDISQIKGENTNILQPKKKNIFNKDNLTPRMKFMELYSSKLKDKQLQKYTEEIKIIEGKENISDVTYYGKMLQISNCVFPVNSENIDDCYGSNGLKNCFSIKNKKPVKYTLKKNIKIKNFLDLDELGNYACKIKTIIEKIINSEGITFIYSNFLDGGIMPLVLALEQNGFTKYDKEEVLISSNKRKPISFDGKKLDEGGFRATYSVIAGSSLKLTNNFEKELNILNSEENKRGELIKVVIGSTVAAEGIDFKNIRNIHLLEPWHNINKLEQVIGRGIRNCSHSMLDDKDKNVTIFLHSCDLNNNESIETYMYHSCEDKATQIGTIEKILKEVSIDKYLFRNSNIIKQSDIDEITIKPSINGPNEFTDKPFDKPYSRTCSFLENCDYITDNFSVSDNVKKDNLEKSTFKIEYSQPIINTYKIYISNIIGEFISLNYEELKTKMEENFENFNDDIFNHSLEQLITDKDNITINKTKGFIKYINKYYVFQPVKNKDMYLSSYYRINPGKIDVFDYNLDGNNFSFLEISEKQKFTRIDLKELNNELKEQYEHFYDNKDIKSGKDKYEEIYTDVIIKQFIIDRFTFRERCMIIYFLIQEIIEGNEIDIDILNTVRNYYNKMIIYHEKKNKKYYISDKSNKKPYGFFLYDYLRSEGNQEHIICFKYNEETNEIILCNKVLEVNILNDIRKTDKNIIFKSHNKNKKDNQYGYLKYKTGLKDLDKSPMNSMICIYKEKGQLGNGYMLSLVGGWIAYGGKEAIDEKINKLIEKDKMEIKLKGLNLESIINIELLLRKKGLFISGDLFWLYNYKPK